MLAFTTVYHLASESAVELNFVRSLMTSLMDNIMTNNFTLVSNLGNHTTWYETIIF